MPRLPSGVEPYHPVQDYDLRVGVLREQQAGEPVGHVLVECLVYWRQLGGLLWWRRWGDPDQTAVANLLLHGEFQDWFIHGDELESAVQEWRRGRWVEEDEDAGRRVYAVSWLSVKDSVEVARRSWAWMCARYAKGGSREGLAIADRAGSARYLRQKLALH